MIEVISVWIRSMVITTLVVSLLITLVPEGSFRRIARLTGGLIFLLVVLQGMKDVDLSRLSADFETYRTKIEMQRSEFEKENETAILQSIAQGTQAYILDKADSLGLDLWVEAEVDVDENGDYRLAGVRISGTYSAELAGWISETLGLGAEKQEWSSK